MQLRALTLAMATLTASTLFTSLPAHAATPVATTAAAAAVDHKAVVANYAALVHANYADTLAAAKDLQTAIAAFIAAPSAEGLDKARKAWLDAREFYGQTEAFRFYGGPIDDEKGPEGQINAWPLDEAYVDYVTGKPKAGMVNNPKFKITKAALAQANERGGEENISAGWHAIEFLLWGQDVSETGPGNRSFEDYVKGKGENAERRAQYLTVATELLVHDLSAMVKAWEPNAKNYRARFEKGGKESVRKIIVGLGSLSRGELSGERMEVALNSQDQEDEHSCFSDNTHRDLVTNAKGIQNVWLGQYQKRDGSQLEGPGVRDLVAAKNPALAEKTTAQIAGSVSGAEAIPAPFDRAIFKGSAGRPAVEKTIASLVEQSKLLVESASAVGIAKLTLVEP
ncbi:MAG: iron-regulated protein [Gammaproteobacteria bacterium]|uniref:imelysin family protein n=1 Tax=Hydrogenophaga sp. TaxID=1904254 RepID=UPI000CA8038B|nr:imelysin family protein [Hydrogenophaga sp.]MBU4181516.1 iron-regulated protein [Gammaproteobacteria bacterium]PKO74973.1 MAG: iron-regulated protein [Betaproteobacteria bacterium HGW-Betaproteobacteria-15]MBU4282309.1 iron-regulated protein [Gammaproteobacteria bacterium]MBU4326014.1 iron-regulated protein [Gammaproteobacteria bacterium]MBU4505307.1 iron-regulated protein [Gammaproteobacteria bacterium]